MNLKPCPFCGGEAEIHRRRTNCRFYAPNMKSIPKNGTLDHITEYPDGRKFYVYYKAEWAAWCCDTSCLGRINRVFSSEKEAAEAWNRRAEQ